MLRRLQDEGVHPAISRGGVVNTGAFIVLEMGNGVDGNAVVMSAMGGVAWTVIVFFFSSRRRHTRFDCDWSSDVCSSDLEKFEPHICATGNMVRALAKMGYAEDHRVLRAMDWLLSKQLPDGGWNCFPAGKHGSFLSVIQPLWALSEMMAHDAREGWEVSAKRGAEFLLKHRVYRSDKDDSVVLLDFLRLHYPLHYCYDFLHGLRVLTELGIKNDPRMNDAVSLLMEKRSPEGKWVLDGVYRGWRHPHAMHGGEFVSRPEERELITQGWGSERSLQLEEAGKPSKWITLQSLLVLKRLGLLSLK